MHVLVHFGNPEVARLFVYNEKYVALPARRDFVDNDVVFLVPDRIEIRNDEGQTIFYGQILLDAHFLLDFLKGRSFFGITNHHLIDYQEFTSWVLIILLKGFTILV